MSYKLVSKVDGEACTCRGCKGERWLSISENANTFGKVICEKCFSARTVYYDPRKFKLEQVK